MINRQNPENHFENTSMNPHAEHSASPVDLWCSIYRHRDLILQMTKREIIGRYRGSVIGIAWSFFQPLLMLGVYTFVFSVIFQVKWGGEIGEQRVNFAIILFAGLIVHTLFTECINQAPVLILRNANYVKKVVFPLEILPVVALGAVLFHNVASLVILVLAMLISGLDFHLTALYLPLLLAPFILMVLGLSWLLAALGVYLRDLGHAVFIITMIMLFISPIFYPLTAVPDQLRLLIYLNPLTFIIEQVREVLIWGRSPSWLWFTLYSALSLLVSWFGFWSFQRIRKGFSDVV